jgi:hypothetical protein
MNERLKLCLIEMKEFNIRMMKCILQAFIAVECPPEGISFIPDDNCSIYWICANGEGVSLTCPAGLYFNPDNHECDYPENVPECVDGTRPPPTTTTTSMPTSTSTSTPSTTTTTEGPPSNICTQQHFKQFLN